MWLWLRGSGWISTPGVVARHDEHAVRAHHEEDVGDAARAREPLLAVDDPLVAVAHGVRPEQVRVGAALRLGHRVRRPHLLVEHRLEPALLLLVGAVRGEHLHVAGVGRGRAEHLRRRRVPAEDLVQQAELQLPVAGTAELLVEEDRPQALLLDLVLQALDERPDLRVLATAPRTGTRTRAAPPLPGRTPRPSRASSGTPARWRSPTPCRPPGSLTIVEHGAYEGCETPPDGGADRAPRIVRRKALALGSEGERWMASLGDSLAEFEDEWGITVGAPFRAGSAAYVVSATTADGVPAVLKLAMPDGLDGNGKFAQELQAVRQGQGRGYVGPARVRRSPSSDAARAPRSTDERPRVAHRGADRRHRGDRGAGLATTREPLALANRRGAGRVVGALDRRDVGPARPAVPRARGAARPGVRPPAVAVRSTRPRQSRSTATPIRGTCSSRRRAGSSSSTPTACGQSPRTTSRSLSATGTTSCSPATRVRRCDLGARAFKKPPASTRKPSGSGPTPNACRPGCSSCASAIRYGLPFLEVAHRIAT